MPTSSRLPWCLSLLLHSQRGRAWRLVCADPLAARCSAQHQEEGTWGGVSGRLLVRSPALPRLLSLPSDPTPFVAATVTGWLRPAPATPRAAEYRLDSIFSSSPGLMAGNRRFCCPAMNPSRPWSQQVTAASDSCSCSTWCRPLLSVRCSCRRSTPVQEGPGRTAAARMLPLQRATVPKIVTAGLQPPWAFLHVLGECSD
jgi:hypothetical protein